MLAEILNDEPEATEAFRRAFDRLAEDLEGVDDPREVRQHMLRFKREQLEDELARVQETWERILRMSALTRIGAYLAIGVVGVAAVLGLEAPEIVCGVGGTVIATVAELFRAQEERRQVRKSPMHLIWRVRERAG
jgi:hypothetical protein